MKRAILFVAVIGCAAVIAAPVRSLLGAKEIGSAENAEEWENPYITDGLIAMWDGEWNAGMGQHSDSINVWKDLTGNQCDVTLFDGIEVESDCVVSGNNGIGSISVANSKPIRNAWADGEWSLEMVLRTLNMGDRVGIFGQGQAAYVGHNGMYVLKLYPNRYEIGIVPNYGTLRFQISNTIFSSSDRYYISIVASAAENKCYFFLNGEKIYELDSAIPKPNRSSPIYFGRLGYSSIAKLSGEICSARVYDRMLSEEEIIYNYSIDCERFDLP